MREFLEPFTRQRAPGGLRWWPVEKIPLPARAQEILRALDAPAGADVQPLKQSPRRKLLWPLLLLLVLLECAGCCTPQSHGPHQPQSTLQESTKTIPIPSAYTNAPRQTFTFTEKLDPRFWFGNADDPDPPESYKPGDPTRRRKWYWRNSCHNFTFYVMGIADKEFVRTGRVPHKVFNPEGGWNWAVCRYKCVRLPFISYQRGDFKFYIGWRERGNFGIKLTF